MSMTIVLLAAIAAFLALRLYSVLGKRTGHEQQPLPPQADRSIDVQPARDAAALQGLPRPGGPAAQAEGIELSFEPAAGPGLQAIALADRNFDPVAFLDGAKSAYRMILEAYWKGDRETLAPLCDADVMAAFEAGIKAREAAGEVADNRFVSFENATITHAALNKPMAQITVRFEAYITAVTRDSEGRIIAGSMSDAVDSRDLWTFKRALTSDNPNWVLDETDAA